MTMPKVSKFLIENDVKLMSAPILYSEGKTYIAFVRRLQYDVGELTIEKAEERVILYVKNLIKDGVDFAFYSWEIEEADIINVRIGLV